jgi:hypothetical protein
MAVEAVREKVLDFGPTEAATKMTVLPDCSAFQPVKVPCEISHAVVTVFAPFVTATEKFTPLSCTVTFSAVLDFVLIVSVWTAR